MTGLLVYSHVSPAEAARQPAVRELYLPLPQHGFDADSPCPDQIS